MRPEAKEMNETFNERYIKSKIWISTELTCKCITSRCEFGVNVNL